MADSGVSLWEVILQTAKADRTRSKCAHAERHARAQV